MTAVAPRPAAATGDPDEVGRRLRATMGRLAAEARTRHRRALVSATLHLPAVDPVALFAAARGMGDEPSLWLQPSRVSALLGLGAAWTVRASGPGRFGEVERAWSALLEDALVSDEEAPHGGGPLLLGGFGFADAVASAPTWRGFEAASLVLPSLLITQTTSGSWLTASQVVDPGITAGDGGDALAIPWDLLGAGVAAPPSGGVAARPPVAPALPAPDAQDTLRVVASRPGAADWRDSVARLAGAVGRGRLDKAVLARQVDLVASSPFDVPTVLRRLGESDPDATVFAICRGRRTFLGATPELLIGLRGRDFRSVAMAGSVARASDPTLDALLAAKLLQSDKEHEEHDVVVTMLRQTLAPLAEQLDVAPSPEVLRLRHLQHLVTPVVGRLRERSSVLRLAERLHPTPAVAGAPRDLALELIAEEERHQRGWYAGPLGWVDRHGDGEFVVALRSGIVEDRSATLLAGCGIVADSDPDREWDESTTKLLALGSALGRVQP